MRGNVFQTTGLASLELLHLNEQYFLVLVGRTSNDCPHRVQLRDSGFIALCGVLFFRDVA